MTDKLRVVKITEYVKYAKRDDRVLFIPTPKNSGFAKLFNDYCSQQKSPKGGKPNG